MLVSDAGGCSEISVNISEIKSQLRQCWIVSGEILCNVGASFLLTEGMPLIPVNSYQVGCFSQSDP